MDLAVKKVRLINWLTEQDEAVIEELMKWREEHEPDSIDQYNQDLERAEAAIERGEFTTHDQAVERIRSWREQ